MSPFKFKLDSIRKLHESERDRCRQDLADAYHADELLQEQREELEQRVESVFDSIRASSTGAINPDQILNSRRFVRVLQADMRAVDENRKQIQEEIQRRLDRLVEADRQVKVLEKLREKHYAKFLESELRKETKELDEIGQQQFVARNG